MANLFLSLSLSVQPLDWSFSCTPARNIHCFYPCEIILSRTPDRDFRCFYPCEIFLSHTPIPALGNDKKNEQPHAGRTSICNVIVMLKWRHHVASERIRDLWKSFSYFSNIIKWGIKWLARKRIHHSCEGGIEKSVPTITICHHLGSLSVPTGDPRDWFFYLTLTLTMDSYNLTCLSSVLSNVSFWYIRSEFQYFRAALWFIFLSITKSFIDTQPLNYYVIRI